ncbi:uncharacterized protein LOC133531619 [Cydia pomonella]|uniref:uncharacterized protein LOC133531619 n=1 Tax=Cydia pomonella TaxID=82600 RepID=UPI002ADD94D6|nr:uncharacterized protein LOC133531619 [Cydia pomonella]
MLFNSFKHLFRIKVQKMVACYKQYDTIPPAPDTVELLQHTLKTVKTRAFVFWWVINGNGFVYHLKPLFMNGRHFSFDEQILFGLEPKTETPNYEIALLCIVTAGTYITYIVSNITSLLIITAGYSEARALTLGGELRHLWDDAEQYYKENFDDQYKEGTDPKADKEINKYIRKRLRRIAQSHSININLVINLDDIFREAIAVEFLLLSLSLIADLLADLRHTYIIMPFPLMQVGMDCFTGQRLMNAGIEFENAIYDSKWENFDSNNRMMVLLILQMAQKNLTLSAGGVVVLGFASLMSLFKKIYSAYTTLQSTMK